MKNPFQYGKVAERENFIDRDPDREFLKNTLYSGTNVILMSPRRWGKSSVVKQAMAELTQEASNVRVIHIDAFPITSVQEFYSVFAREVLKATFNHVQAVLDAVGRFLKNISPKMSFSPEPMSEFSFSLDLSRDEVDDEEVLSLPQKIASEKDLQLIICIDEFQKLAKLPNYEKLESKMRSIWQHQQEVSYCLYGSQRHMMKEIFDSSEKPFYRFGQMYHLKKIAAEDWIKYIQKRFQDTDKKISPLLAQKVTELADCHSWYVQQLASAVWNFTTDEATEDSISKAMEWCMDVNSETYQNLCDKFTEAQIGLLRAIANGEAQLSSSANIRKYRLGSSAAVVKNKRMFIEDDIIDSTRNTVTFLDPIFLAWFRSNY